MRCILKGWGGLGEGGPGPGIRREGLGMKILRFGLGEVNAEEKPELCSPLPRTVGNGEG